ncbi:hypothetical protein CHS0354_032417 [Potamilus streckersoni]|uniref:Uncharacterized protein n=1 Tax=Potamilus streckersoni TaxID=2493646 RepID=A0AAE0S2W1_9BIVA|nr:hypothetical protein CHS0354_032417 [Potamilus streckersoni]
MYDLRLAENDVISGNILELKGTDGTLYVLKDQSINQRDILAKIKDVASRMKNRIKIDLSDIHDGQDTKSYITPSDASLRSHHIAATYNITVAGTSHMQPVG